MPRHLTAFLCPVLLAIAPACAFAQQHGPMVVHETDDDFPTVKENLEMAITGQGLLVSGTLHVSEMLHRTAADLGYDQNVYAKAESLEFCSAALSHRMIRVHPANLAVCPFTIGIYTLRDDPQQVYVTYRRPMLAGDAATEAQQAVETLLREIVAEAVE